MILNDIPICWQYWHDCQSIDDSDIITGWTIQKSHRTQFPLMFLHDLLDTLKCLHELLADTWCAIIDNDSALWYSLLGMCCSPCAVPHVMYPPPWPIPYWLAYLSWLYHASEVCLRPFFKGSWLLPSLVATVLPLFLCICKFGCIYYVIQLDLSALAPNTHPAHLILVVNHWMHKSDFSGRLEGSPHTMSSSCCRWRPQAVQLPRPPLSPPLPSSPIPQILLWC